MTGKEDAFDGGIEVRPPVGPDQLAQVPAKRGVALLEADAGAPIVLLTAADIRARVRTRLAEPLEDAKRKSADLREITRRVRWKLAAGHFEADWRFFELARSIWPREYPSLLAWKPAWFARVDVGEAYPHWWRTQEIADAGGCCFGPFATGKQAERFVQVIQEGFDLCRHVRCLRQAPHAARCAYAEMGRCLSVCNGAVGMEEYRAQVARSAEFVAGERRKVVEALEAAMAAAAKELAFERAAAVKARIDRLAELDAPAMAQAAPLAAFRFVMVQPAATRKAVKVFFVNGGSVAQLAPLKVPLEGRQVAARLKAMAMQARRGAPEMDEAAQWRLGLVSSYLSAGPARAGVIRRWREDLGEEELTRAIEEGAEYLGLKKSGKSE
ncbi:MAG: hypothetical protein NTV86_15470 [Planctomycetota bacterium]|nr:hypothetical protein [Planctomycetota bacterium]